MIQAAVGRQVMIQAAVGRQVMIQAAVGRQVMIQAAVGRQVMIQAAVGRQVMIQEAVGRQVMIHGESCGSCLRLTWCEWPYGAIGSNISSSYGSLPAIGDNLYCSLADCTHTDPYHNGVLIINSGSCKYSCIIIIIV